MSTNVKLSAMTFPYPLGFVTPGAKNASVPLTNKIQPVEEDNVSPHNKFSLVVIESDPANTGNYIYILSNASPPDTTNGLNVIAKLGPGDYWPRDREWSNTVDISNFFIGVDNSAGAVGTDQAIVAVMDF